MPVSLHAYLLDHAEPLPGWLRDYAPGQPFPREAFFGSRVVYYPGCGEDGHAVKAFGSAHAAHAFVYADFGIRREVVTRELSQNPFAGYQTRSVLDLREADLRPRGWRSHATAEETRGAAKPGHAEPFGVFAILERDPEHDQRHGPERLAFLYLGADGIATYDALFCQGDAPPPYAVLLQDHGSGGNYDRFGSGGLMARVAERRRSFPKWLLVAKNTQPWEGYERVPQVHAECGGQHAMPRSLCCRGENGRRVISPLSGRR